MNEKLKSLLKKIVRRLPILKNLFVRFLWITSRIKFIKAKRVFEQASLTPIWLKGEVLERLQKRYPFPPEYGYDPEDLEKRGNERAKDILGLIRTRIGKGNRINSFLELGCWDGMTCYALQNEGKITTAIDHKAEGFDERARQAGVTLRQMDAAHLTFPDESFDFVFSYESFEHFAEPELVLHEAIRVVRTGGYIYLVFGPLYMSPMGLHAYKLITVPYCQFLFPRKLLQDFANSNRLGIIDFDHVNGWSVEDYRKLWKTNSSRLKTLHYYETSDPSHLDLVMKYPSCFRSKTESLDNLIVSTIEVLFQKIG